MHFSSKLILLLVMLAGAGSLLKAQNIYIRSFSNYQDEYMISNLHKITFSSGNVNFMQFNGSSESYSLAETRFINFTDLGGAITSTGTGITTDECRLFPNPVKDRLNIVLPDNGTGTLAIDIFSMDGRLVMSETSQGPLTHYLNTTCLDGGIYLCRLRYGTKSETKIFTKY